jgi:hypothetical protein
MVADLSRLVLSGFEGIAIRSGSNEAQAVISRQNRLFPPLWFFRRGGGDETKMPGVPGAEEGSSLFAGSRSLKRFRPVY